MPRELSLFPNWDEASFKSGGGFERGVRWNAGVRRGRIGLG